MAEGAALSLKERVSYGFGDFGFSLAYNMASGFLLLYYTNVVGLPATAGGGIFLAPRPMGAGIDRLIAEITGTLSQRRWG